MRRAIVLLTIVLSLCLSGCWFGKKTPTAIPPPAPQQPKAVPPEVKPQPQPPVQKPPELPMPPQPEAQWPSQITLPAPQNMPPPRPPAKKRAPPAPVRPQIPQPVEQPQAQPLPPSSPPQPQLGEILSDEQRRQYQAEYAQSLARARSALGRASGRSLNQTQRATLERIQTFIQQAEESKGKDLATALQLVRRADVLGQDLLKDFQ